MASIEIPNSIVDANARSLMANILTALDKNYPGYKGTWTLRVDTREKGGVIQLTNNLISGRKGVQLPISWIDYEMRVIVRYAGELLERYGLSREKIIDVVDEISGLKRDFTGEAIHDE